jgi:TolA-binding protein
MAREEQEPADGLFNVGEFYLKNKRFSHAKHVFNRYLTFYPSGKNAIQAAKNLEIVENSMARFGDNRAPAVSAVAAAPHISGQQVSGAIEDKGKTAKAYYDAVSLVSQGKYQEAFMAFKMIVDSNAEQEWSAKSSFEIGRCMFLLNKIEECLKYFTNMLSKYPKHPELKEAMYIMGQCNEKAERKEQAIAFYKKILSIGDNENDSSGDGTIAKARRALNLLAGTSVQGV